MTTIARILSEWAKEAYDYVKFVVIATLVVTVFCGTTVLMGWLFHAEGLVIVTTIFWAAMEVVIIFDPLYEDFKVQCKRPVKWFLRRCFTNFNQFLDRRATRLLEEAVVAEQLKGEFAKAVWQNWNTDEREFLARCPRSQRRELRKILRSIRSLRGHQRAINYDFWEEADD